MVIRQLLLCALLFVALGTDDTNGNDALGLFRETIPIGVMQLSDDRVDTVADTASILEAEMATVAWDIDEENPTAAIESLKQIIQSKAIVDQQFERFIQLRTQLVGNAIQPVERLRIRQFLRVASILIDLSGRLRYSMRDAIDRTAYACEADLKEFDQFVDLLIAQQVSIGAMALSYVLFDPEPQDDLEPFPDETKAKVLELIAVSRELQVMRDLADFIREENVAPELLVLAVEAIRKLGLPQDARPESGAQIPSPAITAAELHGYLVKADLGVGKVSNQRLDLLQWLQTRQQRGVMGDTLRVAGFDVQLGDWLLMRNPSPYNRFTDLSPGLFTHVGVVTAETGSDGIRRIVIADLPEKGDHIPATNVDAYLRRTLHFFFMRHNELAVTRKMAEVAATVIGNPTQFDLTFKTERVAQLQGKPLAGRLLNTYCAGFLLLCCQETSSPREEFFPIEEAPLNANCVGNLERMGLSVGKRFVSPTGALFSSHLQIVGRREPMYEPGREVREAIFDHFAGRLTSSTYVPSPDASQLLIQKLAELSKYNPLLAKALAKANNVSEHLDLEAAAKVAVAVHTLDEVADASAGGFYTARAAILRGPLQVGPNPRAEEVRRAQRRMAAVNLHADLNRRWRNKEITPRDVRMTLVDYYVKLGCKKLDQRFFTRELSK